MAYRLQHLISDVRTVSQTALAAIDGLPEIFNYFFLPGDKDVVRTVFQNLISYTRNQGEKSCLFIQLGIDKSLVATIILSCKDIINHCGDRGITGYYILKPDDNSPDRITFCPHFTELPNHPNPCDEDSLGMNAQSIQFACLPRVGMQVRQGQSKIRNVIHESIHIKGAGGSIQPFIHDHAYTA